MKKINFVLSVFLFFASSLIVLASSTNGTIDSTNRYAWGENIGWIDFGTIDGAVTISDSTLTGYAWSENVGWISLNCLNDSSCSTVDYSVSNDGEGNLSGYAWSENAGWIQFNPTNGGVTINSSSEFTGYAWGENIGWIVFNCATTDTCSTVDYKVSTDYVIQSARPQLTPISNGGGGGLGIILTLGKGDPSPVLEPQKNQLSVPSAATAELVEKNIDTLNSVDALTEPIVKVTTSDSMTSNPALAAAGFDGSVKALQIFLNRHGFTLAVSGPGSPGHETDVFGYLTKTALSHFQYTYGLNYEKGELGPDTINFINDFKSQPMVFKPKLSDSIFEKPLYIGEFGLPVRLLQQFLAMFPETYPEGLVTGYFGPFTKAAVGRLQIKNGIVESEKSPGYGVLGPKTRALLEKL